MGRVLHNKWAWAVVTISQETKKRTGKREQEIPPVSQCVGLKETTAGELVYASVPPPPEGYRTPNSSQLFVCSNKGKHPALQQYLLQVTDLGII